MTTPAETVTEAAAAADIPAVLPLTQKDKDKALKEVDRLVGDQVASVMERNFHDRESLMEQQLARTRRTSEALAGYKEATGGVPLMGALFQACAKAGHAGVSTTQATSGMTGGAEKISELLEKAIGHDVSKSINLGDASEGGLLVEGTVLELWLEPLRAMSVVLSLAPETVPVTGDTFKVTGFETDPVLTWTEEENTTALSTTPTAGDKQTAMRKAMSLIPVTADYRESASPAILRRLEEMMRSAFAVGFDLRYITGDGLASQIYGLRNLITATTATGGTTLALILADLRNMINSVETNNIPVTRFGILMAPRSKNHLMFTAVDADNKPFFMTEMKAGTLFGWPYRATTNIPINLGGGSNESYVIGQAMNQFFIGQSTGLDLEWFRNASYTEAAALVSSIERDTEVLRGRQKTATLMPHTTSGHVTTGVTWGA